MEKRVKIKVPKLHKSQKEVVAASSRFNVLDIGRRWGKTTLAIRLSMDTMIAGGSVGYFVPTYDFGEEFWEEIKERLEPLIAYKSESKHLIRLVTGGSLKVWTLEKKTSGRSRKYKRVIIDEAAFAKDLKTSWTKAIRATLTDLMGDAWFLSTPQGYNNYFYALFVQGEDKSPKFANWKCFQLPSSTNPFLSLEELEEIKSQIDELTWLQEFEAKFVDFTGRPFAYSFDKEKHLKKLGKPLKSLPLYLAFDFNLDPITAIACQHPNDRKQIRIHKEFRLSNSDIYALCDAIIATYGDDYFIKITGDASGQSGSAMVEDNMNYYKIIQQKFNLPVERFLVPNSNPTIKSNRVLCNSLLARHPDYLIDPDECPFLVDDLKYCEINDEGDIDKKKDKHRTHLLDCWRYYNNSFHSDFIRKYIDNKK